MLRIHENHGKAIGGLYGQQESGRGSDQAIAHKLMFRRAGHAMNEVRVDLAQNDKRPSLFPRRHAQLPQKGRAVALHGGA
jgi:hypothetical protein